MSGRSGSVNCWHLIWTVKNLIPTTPSLAKFGPGQIKKRFSLKSFIRYSEKKSIVERNLFSRFEYILKIFRLEIEHDDLGICIHEN